MSNNDVRVEIDLRGLEHLDDNLEAVLEKVVAKTAHDIVAHAQTSMEGPKSGRIYNRGEQEVSFSTKGGTSVKFTAFKGRRKKVHQASAPGESPAVDTGNLKNSVRAVKVRRLQWAVNVHAEYAEVLEFGGANVAARPFLLPAFKAVAQGFEAAVAHVTKRAMEGG